MPEMGKCAVYANFPQRVLHFFISSDSHLLLLYACLEVQLLCSKLGYLENYAILVLIFWSENLNSDLFYAFPYHRGALQFSLSKREKKIRVFLNLNFSHTHQTGSFYFTK